jgi:solute carrier family 10 (sodium/bile acid cotransporter), member 7
VIGGLWQQVPPLKLLGVMFGCGLLLALALLIAHLLDKWLMSS